MHEHAAQTVGVVQVGKTSNENVTEQGHGRW